MEQSITIVPSPTQADYKGELKRMYSDNYHIYRKEELKNGLLAYFYFLEREITGNQESKYTNYTFTIQELEDIIGEMEIALTITLEQKKRADQVLTSLSE